MFERAYYLFASKSGGYWRSADLLEWTLIEPTGLPLEDYAPTVMVWRGKMYFTAFDSRAVYSTEDPIKGAWFRVASLDAYSDPCLFTHEDDVYE